VSGETGVDEDYAHLSSHPFSHLFPASSSPLDLDQIQEDIAKHDSSKVRKFDQELPGCGQYYCMVCARYFITDAVMEDHLKSKVHKKRVKLAAEKPYSQAEANAAAGMGAAKHD
jgi:bud site selection protein 20